MFQPPNVLRVFIFLGVIISGSGCLGLSEYVVSRPISDTPNIVVNKIGRIEMADSVIFISSVNAVQIESGTSWLGVPVLDKVPMDKQNFSWIYYREKRFKPEFYIVELSFNLKEQSISFIPSEIILDYRGKIIHPAGTYSLVKQYDSTNPLWGHKLYSQLCAGPDLKFRDSRLKFNYMDYDPLTITSELGTKAKRPSINIFEKHKLNANSNYCFAIEFPMNPPDPREEFAIELKFLINNQITPVRIKYIPAVVSEKSA